ncbi:MAG: histidine kinase [Psychroserpens sp.]|nr:histidine kinase [Psychroserpens sp.]
MHRIWIFISLIQEQSIKDEQIALIAYVIFVVLLLSIMTILFFVTFQKRKNKILNEKFKQEQEFNEVIARTQTEIQDQTLKYVGRELHDNIGQLLAYANMQLKTLSDKIPETYKGKIDETSDIVKDSLKEVRALSKSLNSEVLLDMGFHESISNELQRLKRMQFSSAEFEIKGNSKITVDPKHQIILFRILQEFFSNSVKYSNAESIQVVLDYQDENLVISVSDNGQGFDPEQVVNGSGMINMKSRAELIDTEYILDAEEGKGVHLKLVYPLRTQS